MDSKGRILNGLWLVLSVGSNFLRICTMFHSLLRHDRKLFHLESLIYAICEFINTEHRLLNSNFTVSCMILENGQIYCRNLAVWTPQDLKFVWPVFNIMYERVGLGLNWTQTDGMSYFHLIDFFRLSCFNAPWKAHKMKGFVIFSGDINT